MLPLDSIVCGDNVEALRGFPDMCIDLTVTSPPYDNLRKYNGYSFDFEGVAQELWRVTKVGGVVAWVVGDQTIDGDERGTPFSQALHFKSLGFKLHDTMIYAKTHCPTYDPRNKRYKQAFEYMFVFCKGHIATYNAIKDHPVIHAGKKLSGGRRERDGTTRANDSEKTFGEFQARLNVWTYHAGFMKSTQDKAAYDHPAIFPEKLAEDHILSWSNEGDVVLDPFSGSGTTAKMALKNGRHYIGIDVSEEYCGIARRRIKGFAAKQAEEASRPVVEQVRLF
jgi:DNA modification methylase